MNFSDQVLLTLLDKGLLALVVALAAFLLSRSLGRYKSSQAVRVEAAKLRISKLSTLWEALDDISSEFPVLLWAMGSIEIEERRQLSDENLLQGAQQKSYPPIAIDRFTSEVLPRIDQLLVRIADAKRKIQSNRFWLGEKLLADHLEHVAALREIALQLRSTSLTGKETSIVDLTKAGARANFSRFDIASVMRKL